jgi:hypothetical protein
MSRRDDRTSGNRSRRGLRLFALAAAVATASPVLAQNNPFGQMPATPPRPFQEKSDAPGILPPGVTTPQSHANRIERWAKDWQSKQVSPVERMTCYTLWDPSDRAEFEALGHYGLLILTMVTQSVQELPLKRVYLRMPDREIPLLKIGSWGRDVDPRLASYKMYGPYREDGFYLFPLGAYLRVGQMQADLAANRSALPLFEFPDPNAPDWLKSLQNPDPLPGALPNLGALQRFIRRNTSGFPIPTSLPQVAPEARRDAPVAVPQPNEPKRPAALGDLFKK